MVSPTVRLFPQDRSAADRQPDANQPPAVATLMSRLQQEFATPVGAAGKLASQQGVPQIAFLSRAVVLQAIGAAMVAGLWIAGLAGKPFEGNNGPLCWIIVGMGVLGIGCVFMQRWNDVQWLATHVVRIGLLGTVVGLIIAFSAAAQGGSTNPDEIKPMISAVVSGMYVSLYATLLGIGTNLWLKVNLRLLGNFHG
jgi:MotA/TolQ/ExbB proton channel family protein